MAYRSSASTDWANRTNTTVNAPAGVASNDVEVMWFDIGASGTPPTPTFPSGFVAVGGTYVASVTDLGGFTVRSWLAVKVAASEPSSYTINHATASSDCWIGAYSGRDTANPIDVVGTFGYGTNGGGTGHAMSNTSTAPGVTTTQPNDDVIFLEHDWGDNATTLSAPSGSTPTFVKRWQGALSLVADGTLAAAGATGNKSITNNNISTGNPWAAGLIALKPASATAPGTPTGVTAVAGDSQATVSWTAPASDGGSAITDYKVRYSSDGGSTWTTVDTASTATSATVTGLANGTSYIFQVAAVNAVGQGSWSSSSSSVTPNGASGSITLGGAATESVGAVSGSVSLTGAATESAGPVSGAIALSGSAAESVGPASGAITLSGSATESAGTVTGALNLAGAATAKATATAAGSMTLTGSASTGGPTATGSVALSGAATATARATATGSLTLTGAAANDVENVTGGLTLTGTSTARAQTTATGAIALTGAATPRAPTGAAGALALTGFASTGGQTASGSLVLTGTATAAGTQPATAAGALSLGGAATATAAAQPAGHLSLTGSTVASAPAAGAGAISLTGTASPAVAATATGSLTLAGEAHAHGPGATADGTIELSGSAAAMAAPTALGSITLAGAAVAKPAQSFFGFGAGQPSWTFGQPTPRWQFGKPTRRWVIGMLTWRQPVGLATLNIPVPVTRKVLGQPVDPTALPVSFCFKQGVNVKPTLNDAGWTAGSWETDTTVGPASPYVALTPLIGPDGLELSPVPSTWYGWIKIVVPGGETVVEQVITLNLT